MEDSQFNLKLLLITNSTNHTKENQLSKKSHSIDNILIMKPYKKLNMSQYKKFTLIMNQSSDKNKFQLTKLLLITTLLNIKLNMFHKLTIPPKLNMSQYKNHTLNMFQFKKLILNTSQKPDIPLNMLLKKNKLKMFNMFQ